MSGVTFPVAIGGSGNTTTDDSSPTTGMGNGGHVTRFPQLLLDALAGANFAVNNFDAINAVPVIARGYMQLTLASTGVFSYSAGGQYIGMNTVNANSIAGASLYSSGASLPIGKYFYYAKASGSGIGKFFIYVANFPSGSAPSTNQAGNADGWAEAAGIITLSSAQTIGIWLNAELTGNSRSGAAAPQAIVSAELQLWKIG
jgi:hypothetical protein